MGQRPRILYVDAHLHFINPTNTLSPTLVNEIGDTTFFGPGYVSSSDLAAGILRFVDKTGPYDCLVFGPNVPVASNSEVDLQESAAYIGRYTALASSSDLIYRFYEDVFANLSAVPIRHRLAFLLNFDYYSAVKSHVDCIEERGLTIIAPNVHFSKRIVDLPPWTPQERHFQRHRRVISDAWSDFLRARPERIITALHFVADNEFSFRGLAERNNEISIPGVDYVSRKIASTLLREHGVRVSPKITYHLYRIANRIGLPVYRSFVPLKFFNISFLGNLIETRYAYTAADGFGLPIRKYFEIPAAGAVLLAAPCNGFDRIGFEDGRNCIEVQPLELPDALRELQKDEPRSEAVAAAGRKLIFEKHSLRARASQIGGCLNAIMTGRYGGAEWCKGEFTIKKASPALAATAAASAAQRLAGAASEMSPAAPLT